MRNVAILCLLRLEIKSDCRKIETISCLESGSSKSVCIVRQICKVRRDHTLEYRTLFLKLSWMSHKITQFRTQDLKLQAKLYVLYVPLFTY